MSIVEKLKKMIRSKGGDPKGVMTIADGVDRLEQVDAGSGSPVPTESDVMVVTFRIDTDYEAPSNYITDENAITPSSDLTNDNFDKTPSEVITAIENKKAIILLIQVYDQDDFLLSSTPFFTYRTLTKKSDNYISVIWDLGYVGISQVQIHEDSWLVYEDQGEEGE